MRRERRRLAQREQEAFRRRRDPFDVDVLRLAAADQVAQAEQQRGAAAAAAAEHHRDARGRGVQRRGNTARQSCSSGQHGEPDRARVKE